MTYIDVVVEFRAQLLKYVKDGQKISEYASRINSELQTALIELTKAGDKKNAWKKLKDCTTKERRMLKIADKELQECIQYTDYVKMFLYAEKDVLSKIFGVDGGEEAKQLLVFFSELQKHYADRFARLELQVSCYENEHVDDVVLVQQLKNKEEDVVRILFDKSQLFPQMAQKKYTQIKNAFLATGIAGAIGLGLTEAIMVSSSFLVIVSQVVMTITASIGFSGGMLAQGMKKINKEQYAELENTLRIEKEIRKQLVAQEKKQLADLQKRKELTSGK